MVYQLLAELIVGLHFAFILFVALGGLLVVKWRWVVYLHVPAVVWGALVELCGWFCPLTPLENWLRSAGGEAGYASGFIDHYLAPIIYVDASMRWLQIALGLGLLVINVPLYAWLTLRHLRGKET